VAVVAAVLSLAVSFAVSLAIAIAVLLLLLLLLLLLTKLHPRGSRSCIIVAGGLLVVVLVVLVVVLVVLVVLVLVVLAVPLLFNAPCWLVPSLCRRRLFDGEYCDTTTGPTAARPIASSVSSALFCACCSR
jgi:hypothetical protein